MSTRAHLQIVSSSSRKEGVLLYHRSDGYPEHMVPVTSAFAEHARSLVTRGCGYYWGAPEVVGAMIIAWSVGGDWPSLVADMHSGIYDKTWTGWDDKDPDRTPMSHRPEDQNGSGYGVPAFLPATWPRSNAEYWYTLMLEPILANDRGDWRLMMHDLLETDWSEHLDTSRLDPPIKVAQSVDDVITLFHPTEVTYQSREEFVEGEFSHRLDSFWMLPHSLRQTLEEVSPTLAFHGMPKHDIAATSPKASSPPAPAADTPSTSPSVEYIELDT